MAEATQYTFTYSEVVEALIKKQGLHEGQWGIFIEFGIQGVNAGPTEDQLVPAAVVPVLKIGLQIAQPGKPVPGTVDAASVNPRDGRKET